MALPQRSAESFGAAVEPRFGDRLLGRDLADPPGDPRGPRTAHGPPRSPFPLSLPTTTASATSWRCSASARTGSATCKQLAVAHAYATAAPRPCASRTSIRQIARRSCAGTWTVHLGLGLTSRSIATPPWKSWSRSHTRFRSSASQPTKQHAIPPIDSPGPGSPISRSRRRAQSRPDSGVATTPPQDRVLGLLGRNPYWTFGPASSRVA
jgi:hypothetical protein